jgi:UDP-GlcNAc:undecaprenyl-phosphate GlcNAc-1-phosphate transferase
MLTFLWAFMISVFAIPSIVRVSHQKKLLDEPNGRTIHMFSTPRLGGLAIFAGFLSAISIFGQLTGGVQQLIAGCSVLFFIGLKDDIVTVSAFKKFFVQVLATSIVIFIGDLRVTSFQGLLGIYEIPEGLSYVFSMLAIIGTTNALNLIDGMDGLAGSIVLIASISFGVYFFMGGVEPFVYVSLCLAGGILGFLRYNLYKAKIFMGDAGSLVCGFVISVMAIRFVEMRPLPATPTITLGVLFIPLYDTIRVFALRILQGRSPFSPDKNHIHHRFLRMGLSQLSTLGILAAINLGLILFMIGFARYGVHFELMAILVFSLVLSIFLETVPRLRKVSA